MKTFMVGYDLNKPRGNNDYNDLFNAIKGVSNTWWHYLDSTWLIQSNESAARIRDTLKLYIDNGDELLVVQLDADWASIGFTDKANEWLQTNMPNFKNAYR